MNFCIVTDVPIEIEHGLGQYLRNLKHIFSIKEEDIFNIFELNKEKINYINTTYEAVSVQIGILKKDQTSITEILSDIKIPKIKTIHSVVDEEIFWLKDCFDQYFPKIPLELNTLYSTEYEKLLNQVDGFIFYTENDRKIFKKYYNVDRPDAIINPSLEYIKNHNRYSTSIKKSKSIGYLGRVDYRKGIVASLNAMEFLPEWILNVYGMVLNQHDFVILDYFTKKNSNIKFNNLLQDKNHYFNNTSIFFGNSLYEPFGFSHMENLLNYVTPVIGKDTGTHEIFGQDYPFAVSDNVYELSNVVERIDGTSEFELTKILNSVVERVEKLNDSRFKKNYLDFFNRIK